MARHASAPMPFAVSQGNIFTALLAGIAGIGGMLTALSAFPNPAEAHATIGLTFVGCAIFMLRPLGPFPERPGRLPHPRELSAVDRRILWAFYCPENRRRASVFVLLVGAFTEIAYIAIRVAMHPEVSERYRGVTPMLFTIAPGAASLWIGLFGLTIRMRRDWDRIVSSGPEWPVDIEYPGPWRDAVISALRNRLPAWLE